VSFPFDFVQKSVANFLYSICEYLVTRVFDVLVDGRLSNTSIRYEYSQTPSIELFGTFLRREAEVLAIDTHTLLKGKLLS
jgi:hypothetical protein